MGKIEKSAKLVHNTTTKWSISKEIYMCGIYEDKLLS